MSRELNDESFQLIAEIMDAAVEVTLKEKPGFVLLVFNADVNDPNVFFTGNADMEASLNLLEQCIYEQRKLLGPIKGGSN